jgi:TPP-dependent pyruvate/acetoin dehydrogenase alpha subunit
MNLGKKDRLDLYRTMKKIRLFEHTVLKLTAGGLVHGSVHFYIGQEAIATGICSCLKKEDYVMGTHRGHGLMIAKGANLKKMLAEIMGRAGGYCRGKGGTMHLAAPDIGMMGTNGIVGAGIPIATGVAYGCKNFEKDRIVVCFFGDGAINTGAFHESLNLAALWKLPVIYVCENNQYAISTDTNAASSIADLSRRAKAYGIHGFNIDGNDLESVINTAEKCIGVIKENNNPSLMVCNTYRHMGHSIHDPRTYRTEDEEKKWMKRDPILRYEKILKKAVILSDDIISDIEEHISQEISDAVDFAKNSKKPDPEELYDNIFYTTG